MRVSLSAEKPDSSAVATSSESPACTGPAIRRLTVSRAMKSALEVRTERAECGLFEERVERAECGLRAERAGRAESADCAE